MKIGNANLANPYILAPMAGVRICLSDFYVKNREQGFSAWK